MTTTSRRVNSRIDMLYLITREFNSGAEVDQVLRNVLSATVAYVGAADATLLLFDDHNQIESSTQISDFEIKQAASPLTVSPTYQSLLAWLKEHRTGLVIKDAKADARWNLVEPDVNSAVCVPIQLPTQLIGVLLIKSARFNHFDNSDLVILTIIADQLAFALANARLIEAEQQRRRLADTLTSIAHTINSTLNLSEVLDLILEQLGLVIEYDSSSILLYDDEEQSLAVQAARGFEDMTDALNVELPFNEFSPNFQALLQKEPVVIGDVDAAPHWIKSPSSQQVRSWIGAPLIAREKMVGLLTVDSHEIDKYSAENVKVVAVFADHAATAVANAQAVTRLKKAEASYNALFEDSTDMILITTYAGRILDINRRACVMLRRDKAAFVDHDISFIHPELKGFLIEQRRRLKAWREASIELEIKDAYGQAMALDIKIRHIQFKGRDCVEWVGRDISARKELEKMRQDLVNMLVHDLRGPMSNIINIIELIDMFAASDEEDDQAKIKQFVAIARRSGQTITDLIDSILDVSRLEQGELPLQRSKVNLSELLESIEEQIAPQAREKSITLTIDLKPEEATVWIDANLIRRVLINLVSNGVKYTPAGGHVTCQVEVSDEAIEFIVTDDGPGISKKDQKRVFNKFARVATHSVGVGLGLAFCKLAIEAHGGTISVESQGVAGQGSSFRVRLPNEQKITSK